MSSINFNRGSIASYDMGEMVEKEDEAEFFSIAQQFNQRRLVMANPRNLKKMNTIQNFKFKTIPKEEKNQEVKEEKSRKTRSYQEGREFICGACKSGYLSYPALYTHIKTKHNGIYPEGTIRGKNNNNKKRGRPKTLRKQATLQYRQQPQSQFPSEYCKIVSNVDLQFAEEKQDDDEQVEITAPLLVNEVKEMRKSSSALITLPMIKILTIFLYNLRELVKVDSFQTLQTLTINLIKFINSHYNEILETYQSQTHYYVRKELPKKQQAYCSYEKCDYFPVFASAFMKKIGDDEIDNLEVMFLNDLCQWMYTKELTYIRLLRKEEYQVGEQNN